MASFKEQLQKKSLSEIEAMIFSHEEKIKSEKDLNTLYRLNSELSIMKEVRDQKFEKSGGMIRRPTSSAKPDLKSYDDYIESKK